MFWEVHLCGVQDLHDFAEDGVRVALVLLTHQLNVSEFTEVKISFFLQTVDRQFQIQQLQGKRLAFIYYSLNDLDIYILLFYFTCWLSSMISASPPPFRVIGMLRLIPVEGVEFMARGGAGIVFGAVGDVRWGPVYDSKVISHSRHTTSHSNQSQSRGSLVRQWTFEIRVSDERL